VSASPSAPGIVERVLGHASPRAALERIVGIAVLCILAAGPVIFNAYWVNSILTQTFIFGIAAASLIFLSAYGGMISLAQTALMGVSGYIVGNLVSQRGVGGESKGLTLGWDPTVALVVTIAITTAIGLLLGAVAARSAGIYFLMLTLTYGVIAYYFFSQVTQFGGFSPIGGISRHTPGFIGDVLNHPDKLYYIALGVALAVYALILYVVRTPFGLSLQGIRDDPVRMASLGYNVVLHRMLAFGLAAFFASVAGVLYVWWQGQIAPGDVYLGSTINLLVMAVIGGLVRVEGAWLGALAFIVIDNYVRDLSVPGLSFGGTLFGGSFNTIIGVIFLAIVVASPDGLMGIWERIMRLIFRGRGGGDGAELSTQTQKPVTKGST
jgi:branched-chain amino acid transport system permease protein